MKKTLKLLLIILVMSIVMALAACGSGAEDPASGRYNCTSLEFLGFGSEPSGEYIELSSGGKGKMDILNGETSIKWKLNGENISVTYFFLTYEGTLKDGVLVLDMLGSKYTFVKGDVDNSNTTETTETAETADTADVTDDAVITDEIGNEKEETAIKIPSSWYGILISYDLQYSGDVWARLDDDGKPYIEMYESFSEYERAGEYLPLMSAYIESDIYAVVPVADEESWFMDHILTEEDVYDYTGVFMDDGTLYFNFDYEDENGMIYDIEICLRENGAAWDEEYEILPPSYETYKNGF